MLIIVTFCCSQPNAASCLLSYAHANSSMKPKFLGYVAQPTCTAKAKHHIKPVICLAVCLYVLVTPLNLANVSRFLVLNQCSTISWFGKNLLSTPCSYVGFINYTPALQLYIST